MKTSKQAVNPGRQIRIPAASLAAILGLVLTATGFAQKTISKEEYEKRQAGLMEAIAAMEAAEARESAANAKLKEEQKKQAPLNAEMERAISAAPAQAEDSATIAKAKAAIAARETRIRRTSPPEVVALLDGPPKGGIPVQGNGPQPGAKPKSQADRDAKKKKDEAEEVEILSQAGCTFDSKANLVVFEDEVVVKHPQFDLVCDKLIVFLKQDAEKGESAMDKAIATGKRVTVRQVDEKGEVQIGQARKVTFEEDSGNVILEDWPQVQTGSKLVQAKEQSTIIILNQSGKMKINGPSITKLVLPTEDEDKDDKTP